MLCTGCRQHLGIPNLIRTICTMDQKAQRLLRTVADQHHTEQWPALYLLAIHAHRTAEPMSGSILTAYLIDQRFPTSDAERFGAEFDRYRELLAMYDRLKT